MADLDLDTLILSTGSHRDRDGSICLMEAVAWFAREPHSDRPRCTDPVLAAFGHKLNDRLQFGERQLLKPLIPLLVGTKGSAPLSEKRCYLLVDRCMRSVLPEMLRGVRPDIAARLERMVPVVDLDDMEWARDLARMVRDEAGALTEFALYDANHIDADTFAPKAIAADTLAAADAILTDYDHTLVYTNPEAADALATECEQFRRHIVKRIIDVFREAIELTS